VCGVVCPSSLLVVAIALPSTQPFSTTTTSIFVLVYNVNPTSADIIASAFICAIHDSHGALSVQISSWHALRFELQCLHQHLSRLRVGQTYFSVSAPSLTPAVSSVLTFTGVTTAYTHGRAIPPFGAAAFEPGFPFRLNKVFPSLAAFRHAAECHLNANRIMDDERGFASPFVS
jgi:hypothetical protein